MNSTILSPLKNKNIRPPYSSPNPKRRADTKVKKKKGKENDISLSRVRKEGERTYEFARNCIQRGLHELNIPYVWASKLAGVLCNYGLHRLVMGGRYNIKWMRRDGGEGKVQLQLNP